MQTKFIYHILIVLIAFTTQSSSAEQTFKAQLYQKLDISRLYFASINVCGKDKAININDCMIDTGCAGIVLKYSDYKECIRQGIISEKDFVGLVTNRTSSGDTMLNRRYRVKAIDIGNVRICDVIVTFFTSPNVKEEECFRAIGFELFKRFSSISIDINNKNLILKK